MGAGPSGGGPGCSGSRGDPSIAFACAHSAQDDVRGGGAGAHNAQDDGEGRLRRCSRHRGGSIRRRVKARGGASAARMTRGGVDGGAQKRWRRCAPPQKEGAQCAPSVFRAGAVAPWQPPRSACCLLVGLRLGYASLDVILSGGAQRRSRRISEGAVAPKLGQRALAASALASEV